MGWQARAGRETGQGTLKRKTARWTEMGQEAKKSGNGQADMETNRHAGTDCQYTLPRVSAQCPRLQPPATCVCLDFNEFKLNETKNAGLQSN